MLNFRGVIIRCGQGFLLLCFLWTAHGSAAVTFFIGSLDGECMSLSRIEVIIFQASQSLTVTSIGLYRTGKCLLICDHSGGHRHGYSITKIAIAGTVLKCRCAFASCSDVLEGRHSLFKAI